MPVWHSRWPAAARAGTSSFRERVYADSAVFVVGMIVGAGFAHVYSIASSPSGPAAFGPLAVIVGLIVCVVIGLTMREARA